MDSLNKLLELRNTNDTEKFKKVLLELLINNGLEELLLSSNPDDSLKIIEFALSSLPEDMVGIRSDMLSVEGKILAKEGKFEQAIECYTSAIGLFEDYQDCLEYYYVRANLYVKMGKLGDAAQDFWICYDYEDANERLRDIPYDERKSIEIQKARIDEQKKILSYLTHTLRNTLSAGPQLAKTITENLKDIFGDQYTKNPKVEKTINRASSLLTTFNYVDNLIETFKLFSGNKTEISKKWNRENEEDINIEVLIGKTLIQVVSKILFYNSYMSERYKLFKKVNIKQIKESFLDLILIEINSESEVEIVFNWFKENCQKFEINLNNVSYKLKNDGLRFGILFSILSELIFNSIIYFDDNGIIEISLNENNGNLEFQCKNHFDESNHDSKGTNKGFSFIKYIVNYLDVLSLEISTDKGFWSSKLIIGKTK